MQDGPPPPPPVPVADLAAAAGERGLAAAASEGKGSSGAFMWNVVAPDLFHGFDPHAMSPAYISGKSSAHGSEASSTVSMPNRLYGSAFGSSSSSLPRVLDLPPPPGLAHQGPPPGILSRPGFCEEGSAASSASGYTHASGKEMMWNASLAREAASVSQPPSPLVIWCEAKPTNQEEVMSALSSHYCTQHRQVVHFNTPARFTHWLFEQARGDILPWALLVTGWREAKPCAMAIGACRSGDVSKLRPDARRPQLQPILGSPEHVQTAIESIVIVLEKSKDETPVANWAKEGGYAIAQLDIYVAGGVSTIHDVMARLDNAAILQKSVISL
mmetsp:Transcript_84493/g.243955  ORF Transcript_84493/g.243955 Transcript_84493/m.243955 type:complete len:329 (-) Transcript_84493:56-1042(-)